MRLSVCGSSLSGRRSRGVSKGVVKGVVKRWIASVGLIVRVLRVVACLLMKVGCNLCATAPVHGCRSSSGGLSSLVSSTPPPSRNLSPTARHGCAM